MLEQLSWKVGGQQGEGIDSTGEIFATALNRHGYFVYGYRHFSSRIKGGHTNYKIRVSTKVRPANADKLDILIAFDQETIDFNAHELRSGGVIIADEKFKPVAPEGMDIRFFVVPLTKFAEEAGSAIMKNMVALGASACVLGLPATTFESLITDMFLRKGQKVVDSNMTAISKGIEFMKENGGEIEEFRLQPGDGKQRLFLMGNDAIGLGALAAGARIMPAYPITPASDVMEYLIKKFPKVGGHVIQTEDEIAAITMTIGANYAGVRALTATSGPGLSLMMEAIGLAGMTETPCVIVDTQRGGPSTGMPTKHEQSDMYAVLFGTHGEIPKIVLAPATAEECFYMTIDAFNYAEKYQLPVLLITDLALSLAKQTVEPLEYDRIVIDRGNLATPEQLAAVEDGKLFKRYEFTKDNISPRVFPGQKGGVHHVTGVEHTEVGRPTEDATIRTKMMNKRLNKVQGELPNSVSYTGDENPDLLVIGVGSTIGVIDEALERLAAEGKSVGHAQVRVLSPFPTETLQKYVDKAKKVLVVENNATGQLKHLMQFFGVKGELQSQLKYDGNPYLPHEIYSHCKELF
ncbi:2-oxoacid:acceptor oxidoreductase subunit alpha [Effusibacillus lacus]|uniref:2-oxoglutarate ferredoxin oxidoreductase subunit alpha n=1 Tax=Effusibacillus lacus TaxID=1348429 RepID=A0A292YM96_9BACL|nr:2-oxoacid:acceptor oxidoreductase subunit alpha [Effusibacillus lacus]TCS71266.1 2-oxoglutarate ferredoxin oxidoreductase subunit alpha [Effusibacillus lacus]GAX89893.1 2-oxoglutarate ferredoxin oxidoreductase subunit alpha [Effusibacillus lacus]